MHDLAGPAGVVVDVVVLAGRVPRQPATAGSCPPDPAQAGVRTLRLEEGDLRCDPLGQGDVVVVKRATSGVSTSSNRGR